MLWGLSLWCFPHLSPVPSVIFHLHRQPRLISLLEAFSPWFVFFLECSEMDIILRVLRTTGRVKIISCALHMVLAFHASR